MNATAWETSLSVLAYGVRVGIRLNAASLGELLMPRLPPGAEIGAFVEDGRVYSLLLDDDRSRCSVFVDDAPLAEQASLALALRRLETDLQHHVAEMSPLQVFVHAGAVGWQGRAILFPGRSFSGKTTLVAEMLRAGADYFSEEYAALDAAGMVHAYPRPLSIRRQGVTRIEPGSASAPIGRLGAGPIPVGLVVVSKFRAGGQWRPIRLTPGQGVLELLANTVPARRIPELVMSTLQKVVSVATVVSSERGEASSVVREILDLANGD